ncbi:hypothetical protein KFK09_008843 [Dendrobium nobile]|uniref:Uncharacterized protein n=1 Tax=Dendrobium nobile TaxID=94219 RepID=A0A8T3BLV1_DENNO|nr:hypothetical protein KFK09_008843 [Dendrobium nobile]
MSVPFLGWANITQAALLQLLPSVVSNSKYLQPFWSELPSKPKPGIFLHADLNQNLHSNLCIRPATAISLKPHTTTKPPSFPIVE